MSDIANDPALVIKAGTTLQGDLARLRRIEKAARELDAVLELTGLRKSLENLATVLDYKEE